MNIVVGSGPAGVSVAMALLELGQPVTMIDAGLEIEPERYDAARILANHPPETWQRDHAREVALVRSNMSASGSGIPLKLLFGSDFPYRGTGEHLPMTLDGVDTSASLASGGLSNVWGAAVMPYIARDMSRWPITPKDLAPHYRAVASFMPIAAIEDDLASSFPLYTKKPHAVPLSAQAGWFLNRTRTSRAALEATGVTAGRSRIAVRGGEEGCVACGLCMYGCPYGFIYNSASTLADMKGSRKFKYIQGLVVQTVHEKGNTVTVVAREMKSGKRIQMSGSRAYLTGGVLSTTRILLASRELFDTPVTMRDSQYFLLPALLRTHVSGASRERLHTLSQAFIEIMEPGARTVHFQFYTYNDLYAEAVGSYFGPLAGLVRTLARPLLERLVVLQGYLPSDLSQTTDLRLDRKGTLHLRGRDNRNTKERIKAAVKKIAAHGSELGLIPLPALLKIARPGRGFHSGGTFPMRANPGDLEADVLGRPFGLRRIHAADASVFPDIAATTITFTVMANAHRIATESHRKAASGRAGTRPQLRVGITGANGYAGSAIAQSLEDNGLTVVAMQRQAPPESRAFLRFSLEDIPTEESLKGLDAIVHTAYDFRAHSPSEIQTRNVDATLELFSRCKRAGVRAIIYISTMSAFEGCRSLYGRAKLDVEAHGQQMGFYVVRPGLIFGDRPGGMVGALKKLLALSPVIPVIGGGRQVLHTTHEEDLSRLIQYLIEKRPVDLVGKPIIAAGRQGLTFKGILQTLARQQGRSRFFFNVPYFFPWISLKALEILGVRMRLRTDGLKGLIFQDERPQFEHADKVPCKFRDLV